MSENSGAGGGGGTRIPDTKSASLLVAHTSQTKALLVLVLNFFLIPLAIDQKQASSSFQLIDSSMPAT